MKSTFTALALMASNLLFAQTTDVLWIGNSYTYGNDLPTTFANLAESLGDTVNHDQSTQGGATLEGHSTNNTTLNKIASNDWDFVVIQEQSQRPSFPDWQVAQETYPFAEILVDSIRSNYACATPVFFMTWGRKYGDQQNCANWPPVCTFSGMQERLRESYLEMAMDNDANCSPVGAAWALSWMTDSTINLWNNDNSHPNVYGTYLAACTFYATIFESDPAGAWHPGSISAAEASYLQGIAASVVLDSTDNWYFATTTAQLNGNFSFSDMGLTVSFNDNTPGGDTWAWDFGDGNTSTDQNPQHTYASSGSYDVTLIVSNDCGSDTLTETVMITVDGVSEQAFETQLSLFPNPADRNLTVKYSGSGTGALQLTDLSGRVVQEETLQLNAQSQQLDLDIASLAAGIYSLQLISNGKTIEEKVVIQ